MKLLTIKMVATIPSVLLLVLCGCTSFERHENEWPMYDGIRSPLVVDASQREQSQYREKSRELSQLGWEYFYKGDHRTAIKRFNQAWLLDSENPEAWWGFGVIMGVRGEADNNVGYCQKGIKYLETSLALGNGDPKTKVDLAIAHTKLGQLLILTGGSDTASREEFNTANEVFGKVQMDASDFPPLWLNWAYLKYYEKEYDVAKQYMDKAKHLGMDIPENFIQALKRQMTGARQTAN